MDELNEFNQILNNLLNTNTEFRQKSEEIYENISIEKRIHLLFMTISDDSKPEELRSFAAILMRRLLLKSSLEDLTKNVDANFLVQFRNSILELIQKENISINLRKKICDITVELVQKSIDNEGNNQWPELLNFMFTAANSPNLELKECSLLILENLPSIFGNQQSKYLDFIKKMLLKCLVEDSNEQVKLQALKATTSFILFNFEDKSIVKLFNDTVMPMLQITNAIIEQDEELPLQLLMELAESCPQILRPNFNSMMDICMKVIANKDCSEEVRHSAIELVVTFAENAAGTFRKRGTAYLFPLVNNLLMMMTEIEDDESWSQKDNDDDDGDSNSDRIIGETSLDRLACALGGKSVFDLAFQTISQMLHNTDWKKRHAALMAISALGEGCNKQMQPVLDEIVTFVIPSIADPHPQVRYAVCVALGQMANDFAPNFQQKFHDKFIPNLLLLLDDNQNPRVQANAGAAFINFFDESKPMVVTNYVPVMADKFEQVLKLKIDELMKNGKKLVLEQIVMTIAALADLIQESFINYYDRFMPYLKFIIENANHKDLRLLRGKAIECASLIGLAVGSEKFMNDASQIMNLLLLTQTGEVILEDDDPQLSYMITSWVRICKLLGPKFEPYLPMVMPQVLKTASMKVEMGIFEGDAENGPEDADNWRFFNLNDDQNLGIKVSGLDEKATACEMLVCYARELKHAFVNYLEDTVKILIPLLDYNLHEGVRVSAAQIIPYLLDCAKIRGDNYVFELWNYVLPHLFQVLYKETDSEVLAEMLGSLSDCITTLGMKALNEQQMQELIKVLDFHFIKHFERCKEHQEKRNDEDYDETAEETFNDEEDEDFFILSKLVDVLHSLFMAYNEKFLPYFNLIYKHIINLVNPENPVSCQQWAICVIDDLIEFSNGECLEYQDFFLPLLNNNLKSPHAELRQTAAYGIGVLAKHGGKTFEKYLADSIPIMIAMIQDPKSREDENILATENAISAITKIIQFNGGMVDIDSLLPIWLSWLPIWEDEEEVIYVYSFLYQLLESNHPLILGVENCNIVRIACVILEVFARNVIEHTSELGQKLISYIKYINLDKSITSKFPSQLQVVLGQIVNL